ncbi:winged helix-turn-helix domain-containing protein [Plantactinospora sp. KLBMP9567]|uniref:ArsR/SmtB family transcription factor n=1 Tax=Plantactinospora sp. KLBMP9567 TaxID=3085900 RepID=UPI002980ED31|nr:winged helix-turn-helix domain-containing protein [Plantactinospora sp. KLBMP9567]MDW5323768.1 winged helix-turn-helix domain-containing protein [Plantactinospora sp. KLBMP9567]MDW5326888.1 winged helix-turn-helix domain-containing protein [Plantactinospora sp. KLBMP9567]
MREQGTGRQPTGTIAEAPGTDASRRRRQATERREAEQRPQATERREATVREAKALAHPLRLRILRLCHEQELTNKQLANRLDRDPGTVLYHVRHLVDAGLLEPGSVRAGNSGALEKPYRSTRQSWWLTDATRVSRLAPIEAFQHELREAGGDSVQTLARFALHLSVEDIAELDRRICALLDEYVSTDEQRLDQPRHGGLFVLHRLAD